MTECPPFNTDRRNPEHTAAQPGWIREPTGNNENRCTDAIGRHPLRLARPGILYGNCDGSPIASGAAEQTVLSLIAGKGRHRNTRSPAGNEPVKFEVPCVITVGAGDGDVVALAGEGADGGEAINHGGRSSSLVFSVRLPAGSAFYVTSESWAPLTTERRSPWLARTGIWRREDRGGSSRKRRVRLPFHPEDETANRRDTCLNLSTLQPQLI